MSPPCYCPKLTLFIVCTRSPHFLWTVKSEQWIPLESRLHGRWDCRLADRDLQPFRGQGWTFNRQPPWRAVFHLLLLLGPKIIISSLWRYHVCCDWSPHHPHVLHLHRPSIIWRRLSGSFFTSPPRGFFFSLSSVQIPSRDLPAFVAFFGARKDCRPPWPSYT